MHERDETLIDKLQAIRADSNRHWMDIVRLAMELAPERARAIFRKIETNDRRQLDLIRETYGENG